MDRLVEIVAGFAIAATHVLGDVGAQELPHLVEEGPVIGGKLDTGEIHRSVPTFVACRAAA
ncbi:hypothetical protein [Mycobacterium celatum]|uniref:hypothetical protein n=1 Tax=Mycobacterium celatum TaxID=28045 RepID=UPI001EE6D2C7|nr:hypothetical protein [Mycobacterium celatum]